MAAANPPAAAPQRKEEDPKDQDKKRLYVRWEVTDDSLKAAFERFGKIAETRVVRGPRLRAFGFITFESEEAAARAKADMETKSIPAGPLEIQYASAAGAARAREKKERKPRAAAGDAKAAPGAATDAKAGGEAKRGGRRAKGAAAAAGAAPAAAGAAGAAPKAEGKRGGRKSRRTRGRGAAAAGADGAAPAAAGEGKRDSKRDDPNWGKVVRLVPDPIRTPLAADAQISELVAGARAYKAGRTDAKQIASLVLNADPSKGPFNCSFNLGPFALKLLEVKVSSREADGGRDVRVGCRVVHPDSNRSREVYLRVKSGAENKHKFLELRVPNKDAADAKDLPAEVESFFVTIDSIQLDVKTGLWKKIMLSLVSMMVPRVAPRAAAAAGAAADTKSAAK